MHDRCGSCRYFARSGVIQSPMPGQCRESSPQVVVLHRVVPGPMQANGNGELVPTQQVQEVLDSAWPPVTSMTPSCGRYSELVLPRAETLTGGVAMSLPIAPPSHEEAR
jgi:hypothetical protein